jgi:hypothetical protein
MPDKPIWRGGVSTIETSTCAYPRARSTTRGDGDGLPPEARAQGSRWRMPPSSAKVTTSSPRLFDIVEFGPARAEARGSFG